MQSIPQGSSAAATDPLRPATLVEAKPLHFSCVSCGKCCHDLRLTLSCAEAIDWADRGGLVQILCDAMPDLDGDDGMMEFRRARSFSAESGPVRLLVQIIIIARFKGACPRLLPDMRCGDYEGRPNICRIYPAETIPGRLTEPAKKLCPPESWDDRQPAFLNDDGTARNAVTRTAIAEARASDEDEVPSRRRLARALGIRGAALANEGFAVWTIEPTRLIDALRTCLTEPDATEPDGAIEQGWTLITERSQTLALIEGAGAIPGVPLDGSEPGYLPLL